MSGLYAGESVIKESGMLPVVYAKTTFNTVNGKLLLTNMRLVFAGGRFQGPIQALAGGHAERVEIPLAQISGVEKGFMATIKVHAGQEYVFKGMGGTGDWVQQILQARQSASHAAPPQPQYAPPQQPQFTPPPQQPRYAPPQQQRHAPPQQQQAAASQGRFCRGCGAAAGPTDRFCGGCGKQV